MITWLILSVGMHKNFLKIRLWYAFLFYICPCKHLNKQVHTLCQAVTVVYSAYVLQNLLMDGTQAA